MNETRVFITHFSAVVAPLVVVVGAAVSVDCRVCRNQKVENFGQTDLLAGENKYESEMRFPNCSCGVKTFLYFCHLIEIE